MKHYRRLGYFLILAALSGPAAHAEDSVPHWQMLPEKSSVEWTATYGGRPVKGTFSSITADMAFDPAHLDASKVKVKIETGSVKSSDADVQANLPGDEWFAANQYPLAVFETTGFARMGDDNYQAIGTLTLHGKQVNVTLPFTVKFYEDKDTSPPTKYARITGETTLKRLDFGIGSGEWARTDVIADPVKVDVSIEAKQVP